MRVNSLFTLSALALPSRAFFITNNGGLSKGATSLLRRDMSSTSASYFAVHVNIVCKPGTEEAFKQASLANARESAKEEGILRFDVLQDTSEPSKFTLVEVYKDAEAAPKAHKDTEHYAKWRDTVADMMAVPRQAQKFATIFPSLEQGWSYPTEGDLE